MPNVHPRSQRPHSVADDDADSTSGESSTDSDSAQYVTAYESTNYDDSDLSELESLMSRITTEEISPNVLGMVFKFILITRTLLRDWATQPWFRLPVPELVNVKLTHLRHPSTAPLSRPRPVRSTLPPFLRRLRHLRRQPRRLLCSTRRAISTPCRRRTALA